MVLMDNNLIQHNTNDDASDSECPNPKKKTKSKKSPLTQQHVSSLSALRYTVFAMRSQQVTILSRHESIFVCKCTG